MVNAEKEKAKSLVVAEVGGTGKLKTMVCLGPGVPWQRDKHLYKQNKKKNCLHSPMQFLLHPQQQRQETGSAD